MSAARNIEIKYRCVDLGAVRTRAEQMGARAAGLLVQRDRFFAAPGARLKLRTHHGGRSELIGYRRADLSEARGSDYRIAEVGDPDALAEVLADALGDAGVVDKRRHLYLHEHTRIHLDEVAGLGGFVELETVLGGRGDAEGHRELARVAAALGLADRDRVAEPYVELLRRTGR